MTASVIQENSAQNASASATCPVALNGVKAGNAIQVLAQINSTAAIDSVADGTNTYTLLDTWVDSAQGRRYAHYVAVNVQAGNYTIVATFHFAITSGAIWVKEIGGVTTNPVDGHHGQNQATPTTGTDATTSGTATNSVQPALISGFCANSQNASFPSAGTGFTSGSSGAGAVSASYRTESKRITTTTAVAATFTAVSNVSHNSCMAIFDERGATAYTLNAATGTFALSGAPGASDAAIAAQQGSFAITGFTTTIGFTRKVSAITGFFGLTGNDATLNYHPVGAVFVLNAAVGNFVISGIPASFTYHNASVGVLLNDAITLATQAGLMVLRPVSHAYSFDVPYGYVLAQTPAAGTSVPLGTMVILTESLGPPPPPKPTPNIPNVVGMARFDAEAMIEDNGCNVNPLYTFQFSSTYAQGLVMAQSPTFTPIPVTAGTVVTLTISLGSQVIYPGTSPVVVPLMH